MVGTVHVKQIYEIAKIKQADAHMQHLSVETLCKCIAGSALSMGIKVVSGDIPVVPDSKNEKKT
jgi:large subunit ribosomal protein L11